jgi:glutamyl-tRNA reductase
MEMFGPNSHDISRFHVAGINYKKTDASIRGQFAVTPEKYQLILSGNVAPEVTEFFILSTCNRTEIYGLTSDVNRLIDLLCAHTAGDRATFASRAYVKNGREAIEHLYNVSAGLDSQILGDYEIVGQIKQAVKLAKEYSRIGAFIERLVNSILQSSKTIKNQTALSGGTVSVSFSAVQYIRKHIRDLEGKKILLTGIGKIGRNTCRNLVDYLPTKNITLVNRTDEKAQALAEELRLQFAPFSNLVSEVQSADIILVATNAAEPTICAKDLAGHGSKLIIDLSIPYNVETSAKSLPGVTLVNVDELSKLKDSTLNKRKAEVPKAKKIIAEHIADFLDWYEMRKYVPVLKAVKTKLLEIHCDPVFFNATSGNYTGLKVSDHQERIQKVINGMAVKMRKKNQRGCHYIEAINEFMAPGANY